MNKQTTMNKKYDLKPGRHQFAPGAPAEHTNDNLTDEEAEWYLERYPHIAALFEPPVVEKPCGRQISADEAEHFTLEYQSYQSVESSEIGEIPKTNEDLSTTN